MELCYDPFSIEEGLRASLADPPATLLVLPNGWVKVVAALPYICGICAATRSSGGLGGLPSAWSNAMITNEVHVGDRRLSRLHPEANAWQSCSWNSAQ